MQKVRDMKKVKTEGVGKKTKRREKGKKKKGMTSI